jgi:class 3 adenylate cyclase
MARPLKVGVARRETALLSVMFTDIVASTEIASELGDARWRELLSRHNRMVRQELRRFGGREVDTAGDGFLAVFPQPAAAVRCAGSIVDRVRSLGIEIRAGVHVGEVELIGKKIGGLTVHTGARISALAGPGEVLVSRTLKEVVPGSRFTFDDRGSRHLKGLAGEHEVFAVSAVDEAPTGSPLDEEEARRRRALVEPPHRRPRRRWGIAAAALAAVVTLVALVVARPWEESVDRGAAPPLHDAVVSLDPATGDVVDGFPGIPRGSQAVDLVAGEGGVWVSSTLLLTHVDAETGETQRVNTTPVGRLALGYGAVWVASAAGSQIVVVSPARVEEEDRPIRLPGEADVAVFGSVRLDVGGDAVWAAGGSTLYRIDPGSREATRYDIGVGTDEIAAGEEYVWLVDRLQGAVARFDIGRSRIVGSPTVLQGSPDAVEVGPGDEVWIIDASGGGIFRLDPSGDLDGPYRLGPSPVDVTVGAGYVWVADLKEGTVIRIDREVPSDRKVFRLGRPVAALDFDEEASLLWCYLL